MKNNTIPDSYYMTHDFNDVQKQQLLKLFDTQSWTKGRTLKGDT